MYLSHKSFIPKHMDSEYTKVFSGNFILSQTIIEQLQEIGIEPVIKDESESGRLAGFGSPMQGNRQIYVNTDELDKAQGIVQNVVGK